MPMETIRPLEGILVLDFSQFLAGPVAAMRLADLGARVIKIERPVVGDIGRTLAFAGRTADGETISFHAMNRNKEGITADLKNPEDLAYVRELAAKADVIIQNFRPGVMERIGLDYESVRETQAEHRAILDELMRHDPERARIRMAVHLLGVEQFSAAHADEDPESLGAPRD